MKEIQAEYLITTPMFLGNQEGICDDSIRPTSFKGLLRFWWRALNWSKCWVNSGRDEGQALIALHKREGELFGLDADQGGQGLFLLSLKNAEKYATLPYQEVAKKYGSFLAYGMQGNPKNAAQPARSAIAPEQSFQVTLLAKPGAKAEDIDSVEDALRLMGLLGSLGAKARKGFGSVSLTRLNTEEIKFNDLLSFQKYLIGILKKYPLEQVDRLPPFTAFSQHSRLVAKASTLKEVTTAYKEFADELENNVAKKMLGQPRKHSQNMYGSMKERRASPLWMHVFNTALGSHHALILFLPAQWTFEQDTQVGEYKKIYQWLSEAGENLLKEEPNQ